MASGGERGYVLCHDQAADAKNALNWLLERPEIDPTRVGLIGHGFGAAVACYPGAIDQRFAAIISSRGWGHGERKFRGQHPGEAWDKFTNMLAAARAETQRTGVAPVVRRFDVVPMAEHLRKNRSPQALMAGPKGSGLSLMIECLASLVAGNPVIASALNGAAGSNMNGTAIAVDQSAFGPMDEFLDQVDALVDAISAQPTNGGTDRLLMPGERGNAEKNLRSEDGIPLPQKVWDDLLAAAELAKLPPPETIQTP